MARRRSYHRKRRQGRFSFLYKILIFVAICGAIAVALALFFKVDTITVTGNSRYTANQIIEASGIETGDNMFFLNKYHASERITAALPYVETVRISRQLPDTLVVTVTECTAPAGRVAGRQAVAAVRRRQDRGCQDRRRQAVRRGGGADAAGAPGGRGPSGAGGAAALRRLLLTLLGLLRDKDMLGDVQTIDLSDTASVVMPVSGQVRRDLPLGRGFRL